jgi:hypothetical protein
MITLLNQTIDSLYLRLFSCSSPSIFLQSQLESWRTYKKNFDYANPTDLYIDLPNLGKFRLLHSGHTPYEFVLVNPEICDIRLFNPDKFLGKSSIQTGQIYLDFHSKYLQCQTDDYSLVDLFIENCYSLFYQTTTAEWAKVSRADLAVDVLGFEFDWQHLKQFCTRARKIDGHVTQESIIQLEELAQILSSPQTCDKGCYNDTSDKSHTEQTSTKSTIELDAKQLSSLVDLVNSAINQPHLERIIARKNLQTAYIGRFGSKLYARIYFKSNEIKISGKDYLQAFWKEKGWQPEDPVVRAEFSLSGDFLKEFWATEDNSQLWGNFKANIKQLWTYCTENWLRHTTSENTLNSRSPNSEFWDVVASAFDTDHNFCRLPLPAPPTESLAAQILAQAKGCLKSFVALIIGGYQKAFGNGSTDWNQREFFDGLIDVIGKDLHDDITFQDIQERRDRYGCDEFSDTAFSAALRKNRMKLGRGS